MQESDWSVAVQDFLMLDSDFNLALNCYHYRFQLFLSIRIVHDTEEDDLYHNLTVFQRGIAPYI